MAENASNHVPGYRNPDEYWKQIQENINKITSAFPNYQAGKPVGNPTPMKNVHAPEKLNGNVKKNNKRGQV